MCLRGWRGIQEPTETFGPAAGTEQELQKAKQLAILLMARKELCPGAMRPVLALGPQPGPAGRADTGGSLSST